MHFLQKSIQLTFNSAQSLNPQRSLEAYLLSVIMVYQRFRMSGCMLWCWEAVHSVHMILLWLNDLIQVSWQLQINVPCGRMEHWRRHQKLSGITTKMMRYLWHCQVWFNQVSSFHFKCFQLQTRIDQGKVNEPRTPHGCKKSSKQNKTPMTQSHIQSLGKGKTTSGSMKPCPTLTMRHIPQVRHPIWRVGVTMTLPQSQLKR